MCARFDQVSAPRDVPTLEAEIRQYEGNPRGERKTVEEKRSLKARQKEIAAEIFRGI